MATAAPVSGSRHATVALMASGVALFVALALALVVFLEKETGTGAAEGSGIAAVETRPVPSFTGVDLAGTNDVTVNVGADQRVVVRGDDNLLAQVTTDVQNGTLVISDRGGFETVTPMSVSVTVRELDGLTLSGTGAVRVSGVDAPMLRLRLGGTGLVVVGGRAERLYVMLGGTGNALLRGLVARDVVATLSGTGRLELQATRSLDASVSGTGSIVYGGSPRRVARSVTGTGAISEH